jgi:N-acetylneuraminic acid mutarotase
MKKSATMQLIFLFLAVSCIVVAKPVWAPSAIENSWVTKTPLPQTAGGLRAAVVNGKIYAIGGVVNYEYDPAADNWTAKKPMPTARTYFGIAVYQNKIYTIGGSLEWNPSSGSIPSDANEVYDPLTDSWETMQPMPKNRSGLNANVINGKIYLVGGRTVGPQYLTVALNEVYDPANNSWTTKKPIPIAVVSCASAVIDNKIFVIGGHAEFHDPLNIGTNQIYDPETDTWTFAASMPTARAWLAVAVADDMLYAIGGSPEALVPFLTENEQYTPIGYETPPEQQIEPFPTPLIVASVVTVAAISIGLLVYFKKRKR